MKKRVKAGTSKAEAAKRRSLFVQAYIANGGNALQAYKSAGFTAKNDNVAGVEGCKLLKDPRVAGAIEKARAEVITAAEVETGITVNGVLRQLDAIVNSDLRECFDKVTGALLPPHQWPDSVAKSMAAVEVVEMAGGMKVNGQHVPMYTKKVKLWDKNSGIDKAMKYLGLFEKDNRQRVDPVASLLNELAARDTRPQVKR